jgi:hypothetical protein
MKTKLLFSILLSPPKRDLRCASTFVPAEAGFCRKLLNFFLLSFVYILGTAQVPQGFNYQAIARDVSGNPIINTALPVRITIQSDSLGGTTFWIEEHSSVTTNSFGLFTLILGKGVKKTGSTAATFNDIDWTVTPRFIKTEIDYSGWKTMGSSRLWTVPYSMVAGDLSGALKKLAVTGITTNMEEALFEVKNKTGQTVFAVYNEGVRVYVDNGVGKGVKGGFAIGGFGTGKVLSQPLFVVDPDSIRAYIDTNTGKAIKGGFAIGGFGTGKAPGEQYLRVTRDSTRIYLNDTGTKGVKGGFAIGGFDNSKAGGAPYLQVTDDSTRIFTGDSLKGFGVGSVAKGIPENYLRLTPSNYFIGHKAGKSITLGKFNSVMGFQAGASLTTGSSNAFIGYQAGLKTIDGGSNVFIGYFAGLNNTSGWGNSLIGNEAGKSNTTGTNNVFIGVNAGMSNTTGDQNIFIGTLAGYSAISTYRNTFIGFGAGSKSNAGYNTLIGCQTGNDLRDGAGNTFIGYHAGVTTDNGSWNVCIGMRAGGATDEAGQNELGNGNVYIGSGAGRKHQGNNNVLIGAGAGGKLINSYTPINGDGNIFIGSEAGWDELGSNKLYIDNSGTISPLIYGDFTDGFEKLVFNGNVGIGTTPGTKLSIAGLTGSATGSPLVISGNDVYYLTSKRNSKENIVPLIDNFEKILIAQPVSFTDKTTGNPGIGYIAEDFEKAGLKNLLVYESGELVSLRYDLLSVYNLEIIKEQQKQIESQQKEIDELKVLVNTLIANQTGQGNK